MQATNSYLNELCTRLGTGWNRFWFAHGDPSAVSGMRVLVGLAAIYYLGSHTADLLVWFGQDGLLPIEMVKQLTGSLADSSSGHRWSLLWKGDSAGFLWTVHVLGLLIAVAFTAGLFTRVTAVLTLFVVLGYVHRGPMICGPFEPILTMLLFYLCFAPCGAVWSLDQVWSRVRAASRPPGQREDPRPVPSLAANISLRMIQIHTSALYLMMGLTKLGGETWWRGDAVWWLIAHTESRILDLTWLHRHLLVINFWTHAIVAFELLFGLLIWNRLARPLLLWLAVILWAATAMITGLVSFCAVMLIANMCFVPPSSWQKLSSRWRQARDAQGS